MEIKDYWNEFLNAKQLPSSTTYREAFAFGLGKETNDNLLALVLSGQKTATASSYEAIINMYTPSVGDFSIVLNGDGEPCCVIETVALQVLKFKNMTYDICRREGEDENLQSWRENHIDFFTREGASLGYSFSEEMEVLFEDFKVVYR